MDGMDMGGKLELALDAKAALGEGPLWDEETQRLYWVNILESKLNVFDPATGGNEAIDVGQYIGAAVLGSPGEAIVALHRGFYSLDLQTGRLQEIHDPEADKPDQRFNDGKCDALGRFWAGTMPLSGGNPTGKLYRLDPDLRVTAMLDGIGCSNGLAWTSDNKTMYYIDSPTKKVMAYDYDLEKGEIRNPRTVVTIPEGGGVPDGMTIDTDGHLWVAQWGGWQVSKWNPHTGELLGKIAVPAAQVTSCAFGGADLDELYITTARTGLDDAKLADQPHAGGIFRIRTGAKGLPANRFGRKVE